MAETLQQRRECRLRSRDSLAGASPRPSNYLFQQNKTLCAVVFLCYLRHRLLPCRALAKSARPGRSGEDSMSETFTRPEAATLSGTLASRKLLNVASRVPESQGSSPPKHYLGRSLANLGVEAQQARGSFSCVDSGSVKGTGHYGDIGWMVFVRVRYC